MMSLLQFSNIMGREVKRWEKMSFAAIRERWDGKKIKRYCDKLTDKQTNN
jgi:hypothetical protein